jgi:hypothetical protein
MSNPSKKIRGIELFRTASLAFAVPGKRAIVLTHALWPFGRHYQSRGLLASGSPMLAGSGSGRSILPKSGITIRKWKK